MAAVSHSHGYYRISIAARDGRKLLRTNSERAFTLSQLQDLLSPRLILGDVPAYRQLSSCIDLLAFSIRQSAIELVIFSIDKTITTDFTHRIVARLHQHQYEFRPIRDPAMTDFQTEIHALKGPHHALTESIKIHHLHNDWEFDRYSSISFYLHDRRGDWMRLWRLTQLYDNDPAIYYELITNNAALHTAQTQAKTYSPLLAS